MRINKKLVRDISLVIGGALIGSGTTYLLAAKQIDKKYREIAEEEIASTKDAYNMLMAKGKYKDPSVAFEAMKARVEEVEAAYSGAVPETEAMRNYAKLAEAYSSEEPVPYNKMSEEVKEEEESTVVEIEEQVEHVTPTRTEGKPFVISLDEFMEDGPNDGVIFDKLTVSYYEGDDTLVDERDEPIDNVEKILGADFKGYFGYESGSPDVVHIRNPTIDTDFEVLRDPGTYATEVLGLP